VNVLLIPFASGQGANNISIFITELSENRLRSLSINLQCERTGCAGRKDCGFPQMPGLLSLVRRPNVRNGKELFSPMCFALNFPFLQSASENQDD